jgi:hypothetical protein
VTFAVSSALVIVALVVGAASGVWWIGTVVAVIAWAAFAFVYRERLRRG